MSRNPIVTALKVAAGLSAGTFFIAYSADSRALIHPLVTMPLLHQLDPEKAHKLSIFLASWNLCPRDTRPEPARLALKVRAEIDDSSLSLLYATKILDRLDKDGCLVLITVVYNLRYGAKIFLIRLGWQLDTTSMEKLWMQ